MTYSADLAVVRGTGLPGAPTLGGQLRVSPDLRNEFAGLNDKGSWPTYLEGSGRTHLRIGVEAVEVDKDDPVAVAVKAAAAARGKLAVEVEMATGDRYAGDFVVLALTYAATSGDVQRIDFTLAATGPVAYTVA